MIRKPFHTVAVGLILATASCSSGSDGGPDEKPEDGWGPLAVTTGVRGNDLESAIQGRLDISDECVLLVSQNVEWLLLFRDFDVAWDSATQSVDFTTQDGTRLTDGADVVFGGAEASLEVVDDGEAISWVHEPAESCRRDDVWAVHSVVDR